MKNTADYRLVDVSGSKNIIIWKDGTMEKVTDAKLERLEKKYIWVTDF